MTAVAFAFGAIVGSFLNVCIFRIPDEESIAFPASHCRSCRRPIAWFDNVPVVSWFLLGGKCRSCKAPISPQYWVVELLTAGLFVAHYRAFGLAPEAFVYLALSLALVVQAFIDLRWQFIPDEITLPGTAIGLAASALAPSLHGQFEWWKGLAESATGALAGAGSLWLVGALGKWMFKRDAMGLGDVKLLAVIGAVLGWKGVLWTIFAASVLGAAIGIVQRVRSGMQEIPFGPYLGAAAIAYPFFGWKAVDWYFARFTGPY